MKQYNGEKLAPVESGYCLYQNGERLGVQLRPSHKGADMYFGQPSADFLATMMAGVDQGDEVGSMNSFSFTTLTYLSFSSRSAKGLLYGALRIG
jgi:hypothetical protein